MKKISIFLLLMALLAPWAANAQTVTIGTGTSAHNSAPIANYYNYSICEMLFTSAEIGSTDVNTLLSIGFEGVAASSKTYGITVYMKNVDATSFSAASDYIQVSASDVVYTGSIKPASGWNTIELATPFTYDNTKSLLVVVNKTSGGYDSNTSIWKYTSMSSPYMMLYGQNDSNPGVYDPTTLTSLTTNAERPNVQLTFGTPPTCFAPQNLTCTEYTATSATLTWQRHASGTETAWVLQYSTDNTFTTGVQSVTVSTTPSTQLTGLTAETTYYARVRPDCDENLWSDVCEFKPTAAINECEDFEGVTGTSYSTAGSMPEGWYSYTTATGSSIVAPHVCSGSSYNYYHSGSQSLVFESGTNANSNIAYAVMPANASGEYSSLSFYTRNESTSHGVLEVGYVTAQTETACNNFVSLTSIIPSTTLHQETIDITSIPSDAFIAFKWQVTTASYYACGIDDVCLSIIPSATPKPRNLVVSNITTEEATITWEAPADNVLGYYYQYGPTGGAMTPNQSTTETSVNLQDLTPATDYTFIVHAQYADGTSDPAEISFTTEATCLPVTNITVSDITTTGAKLAWTPGGTETSWQYLTLAHGATPDWTSERVITSNTHANVPANIYACTGEQPLPNTEYDFYVRANCGGGDFSEAAMLTFRTACGAITTFPITYGFETSEGFPANASTPTTNQLGTCWRNEATVQNGTYPTRVWGTSTSYKHTGSQALVLPDKGNSTNFAKTMLVFPEMEFTNADGYVVSFWILRNASGTNPEGFKLYVSDCDTIGPNAVELGHYSRNYSIAYPDIVTSSGWYQYETDPITMTGSVYLIFEGQSYYGSATYVDDITIKEYVAVTAYQIVNNVSDPATEMTWNEFVNHWNNGDHFTSTTFTLMDDITVSTMVGTETNPFTGTFNGNSHTITVNLTATDNNFTAPFRIIKNATIQNLKVEGTINDDGHKFCAGFAGDCYGNNTFTNCESAVTINATTEGDGTHGGFIARNNGGSSSSPSSLATTTFNGCAFTGQLLGANTNQVGGFCGWSEYQSPNYARTIFNNCLFAPQAVTMGTANSATFARRRNASYVNFNNCYFMQDFNDGTNNTAQGKQAYTITGVSPVYVAFSGEHTLYNMSGIDAYNEGMILGYTKLAGEGDVVTLDLSGAPGYEADHGTLVANGETFTLTMEAYNTVISGVSCPVPYNVAVPTANLTARSAQVTWDGGSDSYTVQYREVITAPVDVDVTYDFEDNTMQGWTTISNDNDAFGWAVQSGSNYAHGGNYCVRARYVSSSAGGDANDWLISPQIQLGGTFSFYAKKSSSGIDRFQVYVSTTGNDISDFTAISEVITPNSTYDKYEYDLSGYSGNGYVAIVYTAPNDQYYVYVDDITYTSQIDGEYGEWQTVNATASPKAIENLTPETTYQVKVNGICAGVPTDYSDVVEFTTLATCPIPTELAVTEGSVTAHAATITWTENGEATTWIVEYADNADFTDASTETVEDDATYSFDELEGETTYYVRVKAHCGEEDESQYSNVVNFTTLVACQAPTVLTVTEGSVTTNQVELSWTENGTATAWQICLNGDETNLIAANSNPFTLESLTAATSYTVKVRANCGGIDGESAWSNEVSFATECDVITIAQDAAYTYDFENPTPWTCWTNVAGSNDRTSGSNNTTSGSYKLQFKGTTTGNIVAMPAFTPDINGLMLTFWTRPEGYSYSSCGTFSVGYMTDLDDASTFVAVATYDRSDWTSNTYMEKKVAFTSAPAGAYIAFCHNALATDYYWYVDDVTVEIAPTYTLTIEAVGEENWQGGKGGYYLIASPVAENITPSAANGFIAETVDNYDLYSFSQTGDSEGNEWINFKDENLGGYAIVNGKGYLYASKEGTTLTFTGTPYNGDGKVALTYDADAQYWTGWNLVGNPFNATAYLARPFYVMNPEGRSNIIPATGYSVEPMEGIFVIADYNEEEIAFSLTDPQQPDSKVSLNVSSSNRLVDRAIVRFSEGRQLPKFQLRENSTKLYIPMEGKDYAVVNAEGMGDMPVSFKAEKNGTYTMNVASEEVSFSYLHLIDNMTGADIDLLANPTYSFNATTTDYESRFRLVFATGSSVTDDTFGFINGAGNLSIFGIEGEATLQVMDVNGRVLSTETFSGSIEKHLNVAAGIYMLRLINGDNVKVQKMIVK